MTTHNDFKAFLMEGELEPSTDFCAPQKDERKTLGDLHTWRPFSHFLEPDEIYRDKQKMARTRTTQRPVTISERLVPTLTSWKIMANPELPFSALPSEQLDGRPQQAVHARGEFALMRAVLTDAIYCYQRPFLTKSWRADEPAKEAAAWFADNDEHWPFSFINICRALALEPDYLRRGLKRWCQGITLITLDEQQHQTTSFRRPFRSAA